MGRSRESPVFARFGMTSDVTKFARVARNTPKRLPSRRLAIIHRINPPRFRGRGRRTSTMSPRYDRPSYLLAPSSWLLAPGSWLLRSLRIQPMIDRLELREKVSINLIPRLQFLGLILPRLQTNLFLADCSSSRCTIRIHTSADACQ
jgi:hypothetical protein